MRAAQLDNDWDHILAAEFAKEYYQTLREFLRDEYQSRVIYPPKNDVLNALRFTAFADAKAVILGQDPYHGEGQAHGLCFSVRDNAEPPPSLLNIFKELQTDLGISPVKRNGTIRGDLTAWAKRGVLLLNTCLTVRAGEANSHRGRGWEIFTDYIISQLNAREKPLAFILWGNPARAKKVLITSPRHLVLTAAHPSPLSAYRGFFGSRHFSQVNEFLRIAKIPPLDWQL